MFVTPAKLVSVAACLVVSVVLALGAISPHAAYAQAAPTDTPVPPTDTPVPPTNTPVPPTNTPVPPTATSTTTPNPTNTAKPASTKTSTRTATAVATATTGAGTVAAPTTRPIVAPASGGAPASGVRLPSTGNGDSSSRQTWMFLLAASALASLGGGAYVLGRRRR